MNPVCALALRLWHWSCRPELACFRHAVADPAAAQREALHRILRQAGGSAFGREHDLTPDLSPEEFAKRVPVREPAAFEPWVARLRAGETRVLSGDPTLRLVPTSGSTGGRKLIPYTRSLLNEFQSALAVWIASLQEQHPEVLNGPAYWATSPAQDEPDRHATPPVASANDTDYLGPLARLVARHTLAVPPDISQLRSVAWKNATREALVRCRDLRLISLWHPSYLDALFPGGLPHWPQLRVISCWSDGPAAPAAADLAARFPKATLQPKGLLSTEGVVSIPVDGAWPLAIRSHYLEFEQPDGTVVPAHRLEDHGCYRPVLTTGGGLWRYRTGDLVRVEGFVKRTASIRFVGRADSVSDLRGEKLSEAFVGEAIEQLGLRHFALLTPNDAGYTLFTESPQADTLAARLDALLMRNPHYAWARQLGQLDPVQGRQVPRGAAARVLARDTAEDRAAPKPRCLDTRPDWPRWLGVSTAGVRA